MSAQSKPQLQIVPDTREYEERLRQMAENIQEIFWMLDAVTQQVIYVSPAYERICGRSCASLYEAPLSYPELIHPEDRDHVLARLAELVNGGEFDEEFRIVRPDGEVRWVANQGFPIRDAKGKIYRVAGVVQDITKRKKIEQESRISEAKFATAFRSSPCAMTITSFPDGHFVDVNESFEREMGCNRQEVIGHSIVELGMIFDPTEYAGFMTEMQQQGRLKNREIRVRTKSGQIRIGLYSSETINVDGKHWVLTVAEDITARKQAEEALRRSEAEYRSLFEGAPYGILRATLAGQLVKVNPALVKMLGYEEESDLVNANLADDVFGSAREYRELLEKHVETKRFTNIGLKWKRKDGIHICVQASGRIFEDESSKETCMDIMAEDVTERHAMEAKVHRAEVMDGVAAITAGLAHDYCLHLGRILGYSDLLLMAPGLEGGQRRNVEQIVEGAMQARSVTRYLLAMTSGQELQSEVAHLGELLHGLHEFLRTLAGEKIRLSMHIGANLGYVRGDSQKLAQVIIDLAANARDAMPNGGELTIKATTLELGQDPQIMKLRPGPYVVLSVGDTGRGMDEVTKARIFEPFFTTKPEGKGAGLGLSYACLIVEKQSGGEIRVASQMGKGSTFTIYLPCVQDTARCPGHRAATTAGQTGCETILVVAGDDVLRKLTSDFLRHYGYGVLRAKTGGEALQAVREHHGPVHILLTDIVTLGMTGNELAARLVLAYPRLKVIYMMDYGELADPGAFCTFSGAELLRKPFLSFELMAKVKKILETTLPN